MPSRVSRCMLALLVFCCVHTANATKSIRTIEEFEQLKEKSCPMVVKFFTPWCQACTMIAGTFEKIANNPQFSHINFVTVNADNAVDLTNEQKIKEVPTFLFIADGKIKSRVVGVEKPDTFEEFFTKRIIKKLPARKKTHRESLLEKTTDFFYKTTDWMWNISKKMFSAITSFLGF